MKEAPVLIVDPQGQVQQMNSAARAHFGNAIGRRCQDVIHARDERRRAICNSTCARARMETGNQMDQPLAFIRGEPYRLMCSGVCGGVVVNLLDSVQHEPVGEALTPREREILALVADGLTTQRIAARLGIAFSTVRTHVERVREKLGVRSRAEAVAKAVRTGQLLIEPKHISMIRR